MPAHWPGLGENRTGHPEDRSRSRHAEGRSTSTGRVSGRSLLRLRSENTSGSPSARYDAGFCLTEYCPPRHECYARRYHPTGRLRTRRTSTAVAMMTGPGSNVPLRCPRTTVASPQQPSTTSSIPRRGATGLAGDLRTRKNPLLMCRSCRQVAAARTASRARWTLLRDSSVWLSTSNPCWPSGTSMTSQLGAAASCPCDERIDGGSNRRPFTPNSGQHDRQGSCCGYRFDGLVTLLDHRTRKGRQNRLGCHCAARPGGRCAQPVRQQQPAAREEPDGDPIGIHPRIAPRQLDSGSHIEGSEGISATSCS
jgi:hypothetical protein